MTVTVKDVVDTVPEEEWPNIQAAYNAEKERLRRKENMDEPLTNQYYVLRTLLLMKEEVDLEATK